MALQEDRQGLGLSRRPAEPQRDAAIRADPSFGRDDA
jgi:hypothetical protein